MNKRHYEHTLPNIRGSLSNTYVTFFVFQLQAPRLPIAGCRARSPQPSVPQLRDEEKNLPFGYFP